MKNTFVKRAFYALSVIAAFGGTSAYLYAHQSSLVAINSITKPNQQWRLLHSYETMAKAGNPSYGLTDENAQAALKKQAESGDLNAGFSYARLLSFQITFLKTDQEVKGLAKALGVPYVPQPRNIEKTIFAQNVAKMFDTLAKMGHPPATEYAATAFYVFDDTSIQKASGISYDDYFNEVEKYYQIAYEGGMRDQVYISYPMILIIGAKQFKKIKNIQDISGQISITPYKHSQSFARQKQAMEIINISAQQGSSVDAALLAEGYINGIGVAKDNIAAYAWAKLALKRGTSYQMTDNNTFVTCAAFLKDKPNMTTEQIIAAERKFEELDAALPTEKDADKWLNEIVEPKFLKTSSAKTLGAVVD